MSVTLSNFGFKKKWEGIWVDRYSGYYPNMTDYHMHEYYELSIIISGEVNVLLSDSAEHSTESKVVLLRPLTPHYIYCEPSILYSRVNISFSSDFLSEYSPRWQSIISIFSKGGAVLKLSPEKCQKYVAVANEIEKDKNPTRQKLLLMYLISLIADNLKQSGNFTELPTYITEALSFISTHYKEKIVAAELAERLNIGRTTLMTAFKKYTGTTLNEYLLGCRLKNAIGMLKGGMPIALIAEECGFTDAPNFIRCFKKHFGTTPSKYCKP